MAKAATRPTNEQLARRLDEHAEELGLAGANPYRIRAYRRAARGVAEHGAPVAAMAAAGGDLRAIPGVGQGIAAAIKALVETGSFPPPRPRPGAPPAGQTGVGSRGAGALPAAVGATDLSRLENLGPKRARALAEAGIATVADLERAARDGRLRAIAGFGATLEARILASLQAGQPARRRIRPLLITLERRLADAIRAAPGVERVEAAGSYRRKRDTLGDLDFVATGGPGAAEAAMDALQAHAEVAVVLARGPTKMSVRLTKGMQVDLRVVPPESFGAALLYFTGSKEHNVRLRAVAQDRGLKLNEYGLFRTPRRPKGAGTGEPAGDALGERVAGSTEDEVYAALGLPAIAPELREDRGEVQAAAAGRLPKLVTLADLKGDLHTHTDWTDGHSSLEAMARAALRRGLRYIAVTDHTPRTAVAGGMSWVRHQQQHRLVDQVNRTLEGEGHDFRVLKGAEVDILKDGRLDLPPAALRQLDVVVASLHFRERQPPSELTARVLTAMGTGDAHILGHPSGRLLGKRPPMEHDWGRLVEAAADQGWAFECDGSPWRQDLWDSVLLQAKRAKVKVALDSDAHATNELAYIEWAVDQARRGWIERRDVLNARSADQLLKLLS